jgi:hypothetical protein
MASSAFDDGVIVPALRGRRIAFRNELPGLELEIEWPTLCGALIST